tara:strand:+ start:199 stop:372 length:174 start_codon:yes stop_codon:yes gene_type:complete
MQDKIRNKIDFLVLKEVEILNRIKKEENIDSEYIIYNSDMLKEIKIKITAYTVLLYD